MQWSFPLSLMVFLIIVFICDTLSTFTSWKIPLPFTLGVLCVVGYATGLLSTDMPAASKLVEVGSIAFSVLIIHGGTTVNFRSIGSNPKPLILSLVGVLVLSAVLVLGLTPFIGRDLALLAPGSSLGGGAANAISQVWVGRKKPELSAFPWMVFMFQTMVGVPLTSFFLKKASAHLLENQVPLSKPVPPLTGVAFHEKIPQKYKTTAYYLGFLMVLSVLNGLIHRTFLSSLPINLNATALLLGIIVGNLGLLEPAPLFKSDSFGLLMLGLMSLMAQTLALTPLGLFLSYLGPALAVCVVSGVVLVGTGYLLAYLLKENPSLLVAQLTASLVTYPSNMLFLQNQISKSGASQEEQSYLKAQLLPRFSIGPSLVTGVVSILLAGFFVEFV